MDWEETGKTLGAGLTAFRSLVVCGTDPTATAQVAIGIGRSQASRRRVALGDLLGHAAPFVSLVPDDDVHGLVDSFNYGVSLSRIARSVRADGEMFVLPTGSETPDYDDLFGKRQWNRLSTGFLGADSLLILAVPADAPHIEQLVSQTDGAVIVGDFLPPALSISRVVKILRDTDAREPRESVEAREPRPSNPRPSNPGQQKIKRPTPTTLSASDVRRISKELEATAPAANATSDRLTLSLAGAAGIGMTVAIGLVVLVLAAAPLPHGLWGRSAGGGGGTGSRTPSDSTFAPGVKGMVASNPVDSSAAAAFGVEVVSANTEAAAIFKLRAGADDLPAGTFVPVKVNGATWFKVRSGAFTTRTGADSLLATLRGLHRVDSVASVVVRVPYAFLLDSGRPRAAVPGLIEEFLQRGIPAYALWQDDGTAWVLVGAFESPAQASRYESSLRNASLAPQLVFRKGRMF